MIIDAAFRRTPQSGKAVGGVAGKRQIVGHAPRREAAERPEGGLVGQFPLAPIDLNDSIA
jgi:hypothetical protein